MLSVSAPTTLTITTNSSIIVSIMKDLHDYYYVYLFDSTFQYYEKDKTDNDTKNMNWPLSHMKKVNAKTTNDQYDIA